MVADYTAIKHLSSTGTFKADISWISKLIIVNGVVKCFSAVVHYFCGIWLAEMLGDIGNRHSLAEKFGEIVLCKLPFGGEHISHGLAVYQPVGVGGGNDVAVYAHIAVSECGSFLCFIIFDTEQRDSVIFGAVVILIYAYIDIVRFSVKLTGVGIGGHFLKLTL